MTPSELPAPLVPAEVDLRDFAFMPLDVVRLRDSGLTAKASGDEFRAAVLLWCASWHQVPAASLPDDDDELANICGYSRSRREWAKVRAGAMRGWKACSDGRLYHVAVAGKALEAWIEKLASAIGGATGNAKRWGVQIDTATMRRQFGRAVDALRAIDPQSRTLRKKAVAVLTQPSPPESPGDSRGESPPDSPPDRKGQGQGQGIDNPQPPEGGKKPRKPKADGAVCLRTWLDGLKTRQEQPVPPEDPVFAYAQQVGIPREFLALAWRQFRHRYTEQHPGKRYRDWRRVFRNAVEGNWLKLWWLDPASGQYALTTVGLQAQRSHEQQQGGKAA